MCACVRACVRACVSFIAKLIYFYVISFPDMPGLLDYFVQLTSPPLEEYWSYFAAQSMLYMTPFVADYRADLNDSCDWVRSYTGFTFYDGFCLVEDGADRDLDCTRFRKYQKQLEVCMVVRSQCVMCKHQTRVC